VTAVATDRRELLDRVIAHAVASRQAQSAVPGVVVGSSVSGLRTVQGFGVTSVEDPLPVDGKTLFQIGSVSKTVVALLIARMVEAGTLRLDQSVQQVLPDALVDPRITILHLLTHSSGVSGDRMILDAPLLLAGGGDDRLAVAIDRLAGRPLDFAPGSAWSYSNAGIMLAAAVLEAVDGRPYAEQLREDVIGPLGLHSTCTTADEAITRRVAVPHGVDASGSPIVLRDAGWQRHWQLPGWDVPGGGIVSSADDLLTYAEYLLSETAPESLLTPRRRRDRDGEWFALSWYLDDHDGQTVAWHDGLTTGYCTRLLLIPSAHTAVIVLTNGSGGERVHEAVAAEVVGEVTGATAEPVPLAADGDVDAVAGDYDAGVYGVIRVARGQRRGRLAASVHSPAAGAGDAFRLELPPLDELAVQSDGDLRVLAPDSSAGAVIGCVRDPDGSVRALRIADRLAPRVGGRRATVPHTERTLPA
jgi:CubicO group peptidase (beta-lactamase class C family)